QTPATYQTHSILGLVLLVFFLPALPLVFFGPICCGGLAINWLIECGGAFFDEMDDEMDKRTSIEELESKKDNVKLRIETTRMEFPELEDKLRKVQKNREQIRDELFLKVGRELGGMSEEFITLADTVLELREFMEALADDPIKDTSRWKEKEVVRRQHADME